MSAEFDINAFNTNYNYSNDLTMWKKYTLFLLCVMPSLWVKTLSSSHYSNTPIRLTGNICDVYKRLLETLVSNSSCPAKSSKENAISLALSCRSSFSVDDYQVTS